jgi:hypothetical protein
MSCSAPKILGFRKWFESRFADLCFEHDALYVLRKWRTKLYADFLIAAKIVERGYFWLGFGTLAYTLTIGTAYWVWKTYTHKLKYWWEHINDF